jgi:hypothetical protein
MELLIGGYDSRFVILYSELLLRGRARVGLRAMFIARVALGLGLEL